MALQAEETQQQQIKSPPLILDGLLCEEEDLGDYSFETETVKKKAFVVPFFLNEHDLLWEDDELISLMSKEKQAHVGNIDVCSEVSFVSARKRALDWIFKVKARHGFNSLTMLLAVNYFDRFVLSFKFQKDKPWMGQLAAVACLSLAAKVEETQVPLLLDLQVEEAQYVFDSKTVQGMELLVLSTLQWRMNPVTPISFFDHITRRLGLKTNLHWELLYRCERLLLFLITDSRFMLYAPSILAAATMLHVIKEVEPCHHLEYKKQLIGVLKTCEDKVNACNELISESLESQYKRNQGHKRKHKSIPSSPNGVIDASFSCDSSDDSWVVTSSVSSSLQQLFKRSRAQDQQMRLPSLNRMFVDSLSRRS
ncbi:Cyclin-D3-2 [Hibiscus syriacus]|uniref:Cyclin-D3-2 n=1 Tax=Hibiscus syriacus TaxID=106335 RepID=A0A6A3AEC3_HIBSY|nr:cyclin-D3-3-like [Hibiscus syriacus]KAE8701192.1 Cyclin-D3-2 [Hibiscus syriacus]